MNGGITAQDTDEGWHPEKIKAVLRVRFGTMKAVSERLGYCESAVRNCLKRRWPKLHGRIADLLGVDKATIWPQYYAENKNPERHKYTRRKRNGQRENRAAA